MRINVLAALSSAASAVMWFLITERVLVSWFAERWQRIAGGGAAALIGATAFTVWNQSVVNEKVYTVSLLGIAAISPGSPCAGATTPTASRPTGCSCSSPTCCGLGYANHMAGMLAAPAVGARRAHPAPAHAAALEAAPRLHRRRCSFGMTPFATQPIRAAHFPAINEGEPTACATEIERRVHLQPRSRTTRFMYNFNRGQYGKPHARPSARRRSPAQVGM